jgi:hypothetical protein
MMATVCTMQDFACFELAKITYMKGQFTIAVDFVYKLKDWMTHTKHRGEEKILQGSLR